MDAGQVRAGNVECAWDGSGRDHQAVIGQARVVVEQERVSVGVQPNGADTQPQVDLLLLIPICGTQEDAILVFPAGEDRLRERRALVGRLMFRAYEY